MLIVRLHGQIGPNGLVPSPMGQSRGSFCKVSPLHKHTAAVLKCAQLWCLRYRNGFRIYGQGQSRTCEKNSIYQPRLYHSIFKKKTFHVPWRPLWWKSLTFLRKWLRCTGPGFQRVIRNRGPANGCFHHLSMINWRSGPRTGATEVQIRIISLILSLRFVMWAVRIILIEELIWLFFSDGAKQLGNPEEGSWKRVLPQPPPPSRRLSCSSGTAILSAVSQAVKTTAGLRSCGWDWARHGVQVPRKSRRRRYSWPQASHGAWNCKPAKGNYTCPHQLGRK